MISNLFICDPCTSKLIDAIAFRDKCIDVYNKDETYVKSEARIESENLEIPEDFKTFSKEEEPLMIEEHLDEHLEEMDQDPLHIYKSQIEAFDSPRIRYRYTLKEKLHAIKTAEEVGNRKAEKILQIGESCIRKWRSQKDEILNEENLERNRLKRRKNEELEVDIKPQPCINNCEDECKCQHVTIAFESHEKTRDVKPRKSYTSAQKLEAISCAEEMGNRQAAKIYRMDESCIRKWRSQKEQLIKLMKERNTKRIPNLKFPEVEERLKEFVAEKNRQGIVLRPNEIKQQSIIIAKELNVENFKGTSSYIFKFMERYQIPSRRSLKTE